MVATEEVMEVATMVTETVVATMVTETATATPEDTEDMANALQVTPAMVAMEEETEVVTPAMVATEEVTEVATMVTETAVATMVTETATATPEDTEDMANALLVMEEIKEEALMAEFKPVGLLQAGKS